MDMCQLYLEEAVNASYDIQTIDTYTALFEAEDENVAATEKMNNVAADKSKNFFQKAVDAIKQAIGKLRAALRDFIDRIKLKGSEKDEFEKFCEEMKNNPEFKNKKITVRDWRRIEKQYNSIVKDIEREIENVQRTNEASKPKIMDHLEKQVAGFTGFAKATAVQVIIGQLEQRSKWDEEFARKLDFGLKADMGAVDNFLKKTIGEKDTQAFKKKTEAYASEMSLRRLLVNLRQKYMSVEKQARIEEKEQKKAIMNSIRKSTKYIPSDFKKDAVRAGMSVVGNGVRQTMGDKRELKRKERYLQRLDRDNKRMDERNARSKENMQRRAEVNALKKKFKEKMK